MFECVSEQLVVDVRTTCLIRYTSDDLFSLTADTNEVIDACVRLNPGRECSTMENSNKFSQLFSRVQVAVNRRVTTENFYIAS